MYEYRAIITKVYDGDTLTADVDMGFNIWSKNIKIRVLGIDTPEIRSKVQSEKKIAYLARDRVRDMCLGKEVIIRTKGRGKYGRWLAEVIIDEKSLGEILISESLAKPSVY
jgi:micrococcal nuclease